MKKVIKSILMIVMLLFIFLVTNGKSTIVDIAKAKETSGNADKIAILTFHRLVPEDVKKEKYPDNQWVGSIDIFADMMAYLYNNNYNTISTEEFYKWYKGDIELDKKTVMITFDDGFYEDYYLAYPILKKYNLKATSFVVGNRTKDVTRPYDKNEVGFIGYDAIKKVRKEYPNYEFQSHSYNMHYYTKNGKHRIKSMGINELQKDIDKNKKFGFTAIAYPFGDYNELIEDVLDKNGYSAGFRFTPSKFATRDSDRFAIPRVKINANATLETLIEWLEK